MQAKSATFASGQWGGFLLLFGFGGLTLLATSGAGVGGLGWRGGRPEMESTMFNLLGEDAVDSLGLMGFGEEVSRRLRRGRHGHHGVDEVKLPSHVRKQIFPAQLICNLVGQG